MAAMARRTATPPPEDFDEHVVDIDVGEEMRTSFLEYAYSVIYSRALPDARDGLKPVQRRILHTMDNLNLRPDRGHVKSARVVGEVMGRLHPHGDGAIYDALVRQVQPWVMRVPLVDGHGNFGSPDAGPAAMRYTECRMADPAVAMTDSIDEDTVDFKPNYDSRETEPTVLPAALPNLLVNGASGIAVGMATNMAPHNLVEVVGALRHLLAHPGADLDDVLRFVPGPDLPTGGKIVGLDGIREAYQTGRGSFRMRATTRVEQVSARRKGIVVTELPYGVGPEKVIERIKTLVQAKRLQGIAAVNDYSDLDHPLQLVIEVKGGFHPEVLLEALHKLTPMEDSFGINAVALVDGQPRTLGLLALLRIYLDHRRDVARRRSTHRRDRAAARLHLVDGLVVAIADIDEVIQLIRTSDDAAAARGRLMAVFDLTEAQASHILDLPLRRLTRFSRLELEKEQAELRASIEALERLLADPALLDQAVGAELTDVARRFGTPRRTVLLQSAGQPVTTTTPLEVADDPCFVLLGATGLLARTSSDQPLGTGAARTRLDAVVSVVRSTARGEVGAVTSAGRVHRLGVLDLPALPGTEQAPHLQGGAPLSEFLALGPGERVLALTSLAPSGGLAVGTARGVVKRVQPDHPSSSEIWDALRLDEGDRVVGAVELAADSVASTELVFVTSDAQLLRFGATAVRPQGRAGGGVAGVRLSAGAEVVFFGTVRQGAGGRSATVVTVAGSGSALPGTETGTVKVTPFADYPAKGRATGGVRCHRLRGGEDRLLLAWVGQGPALATAGSGAAVELPAATGRRDGSGLPVAQPISAVAAPAASQV